MRKSTGIILWVLIFSFGLLWMLADTNFFDVLQRGPQSLGAVNGQTISLEEYNNRLSSYTEQYSRQTGNSVTSEMRAEFEQQAWNDLVNSKLLEQKMDELGIVVSDQEVVDMITGENPDPFIRQQFQKEDGTIDRVALQAAIEAPENTQLWITVEQQMRQKRRQQKLGNYLQSSIEVSDYEIEQQYIRDNTRADISYVRFPYSEVTTNEITVSDSDLQEYYNNNIDDFGREESYRFDYVSFDKSPTREDTLRTLNEMEELRADFAETENDSLFLNRYQSTTAYKAEYINKNDINELYAPVLDLQNGEVSEVINDQGRVYLIKKLDETPSEVKFVVFSQDITADPIATIDERAKTADDFSFFAQEGGFENEAEQRDMEIREAFATKGNTFISGLGQSRQIITFLEGAEESNISEPIELSNQFVVIKVTDVTPAGPESFEDVKEQIRTAVITEKRKELVETRVEELLSQYNSLEELASADNKEIMAVDGLQMSDSRIDGAGEEPKVVGAAFGLKEGEQSGAIKGTSAVFVVQLQQREDANLDNLTAEQRAQIRRQLEEQKSRSFMNIWLEELKEEADIEDNRSRLFRS